VRENSFFPSSFRQQREAEITLSMLEAEETEEEREERRQREVMDLLR